MKYTSDEYRKTEDSRTIQTHLVMPMHLNAANTLFGGQLLSWIDMTAGIVGLRHADSNVVTVAIDRLEFREPARATDVVVLDGYVTWVGGSSMEVRVDTYRENKGGERLLINTAYLVMVAVDDESGRPVRVPRILLETEAQRREWEAGEKRAMLRKERRRDNY